ncbi:MAG: gamma-glutamyltransferase family protein [Proteobacteria bacterium]|nr:gamma-glutamyltransferase family protein [Pseudomonadota bacterium]
MFTTRPEIQGTFGAVSSTHWLASSAAMAMLERGGNAFDAVVAGAMVLQVVEPHLNGPGGEVPIILYSATEKRARVICGQGVAPQAATPAYFDSLGLDMVPGTGLLSAVVPGAFDAWMLLLHDYGTMTLAEVFEIAHGYAEHGVPVHEGVTGAINGVAELFRSEWTSSADTFIPGGEVPQPGTLFANKGIAETWTRLLREAHTAGAGREAQIEAARTVWSQGFVAKAIAAYCRDTEAMDTSGKRHAGLLTMEDMAQWRATYEEPLAYDYHGHTVLKTGPWAQAPVFLQQLALLKGFDVAAMDPLGADFVHTVVECAKLAFADREAYYGDPDFGDVPMAGLLADGYNDARRKLVGGEASMELRPGSVDGRNVRLGQAAAAAASGAPGAGEPTVAKLGEKRGDTCHIDVVDRWGNMVTATPSGGWLQSSPVIPALGFPLTSRAQMFWLEDGLPGTLAPKKRPRTTLTPTMVLRGGKPYMALGTPGGDQQDQWQMIAFLRHVHHGMNLQEMIDAPSFHTEHFPSSFYPRAASPGRVVIEDRFSKATLDELARRGHLVEAGDPWSEGRLSAVSQDGGMIRAGANPRGMQGYAVGR